MSYVRAGLVGWLVPDGPATLFFNENGTYGALLSRPDGQGMTVPASCLGATGATTCDQYGTNLSGAFGTFGGGPGPRVS